MEHIQKPFVKFGLITNLQHSKCYPTSIWYFFSYLLSLMKEMRNAYKILVTKSEAERPWETQE